jgi:hypothetical protein
MKDHITLIPLDSNLIPPEIEPLEIVFSSESNQILFIAWTYARFLGVKIRSSDLMPYSGQKFTIFFSWMAVNFVKINAYMEKTKQKCVCMSYIIRHPSIHSKTSDLYFWSYDLAAQNSENNWIIPFGTAVGRSWLMEKGYMKA